jgi:hypothetical protein
VAITPSSIAAPAFVMLLGACQASGESADSGVRQPKDVGGEFEVDAGENDADASTSLPWIPSGIPDAALAAVLASASLDAKALEATCDAGPTDSGIGLTCTRGGRQCAPNLICTANFRGDSGICTILGCGLTPDACAPGASCCTLLQAGGVSLCLPDSCLPGSCLEGY